MLIKHAEVKVEVEINVRSAVKYNAGVTNRRSQFYVSFMSVMDTIESERTTLERNKMASVFVAFSRR